MHLSCSAKSLLLHNHSEYLSLDHRMGVNIGQRAECRKEGAGQ